MEAYNKSSVFFVLLLFSFGFRGSHYRIPKQQLRKHKRLTPAGRLPSRHPSGGKGKKRRVRFYPVTHRKDAFPPAELERRNVPWVSVRVSFLNAQIRSANPRGPLSGNELNNFLLLYFCALQVRNSGVF